LNPKLADFAISQLLAIFADNANFRPSDATANAAPEFKSRIAANREPNRLRHPPADLDRQAGELLELALPHWADHVAARIDSAQRSKILAPDFWRLQQLCHYVDMRDDEARCRRAQGGDVTGFVKLSEQPDRAAAQQHAKSGDKSARMDLRLADENPIASVNSIERITCRCEDRQGRTMGVQKRRGAKEPSRSSLAPHKLG
jgi:hypothetical protein